MQVEFAKHERLLKKMAYRFHRRAVSAGAASLLVEDVYQEMCVAWCLAREAWSPDRQVPFTAFLVRGVRNQLNRWLDKQIWHGQDKLDLDDTESDEDDGDTMHAVVADTRTTNPELAVIEADDLRVQQEILSPDARKFLEILASPPPALYEIVKGFQAKRAYAQERGVTPGFYPATIKASLIFDVMGCDKRTRKKISDELHAYANLETLAND